MISPDDMTRFTNNEIVNMYSKLQEELTKTIINKLKKAGDINSYTRQQIINLRRIGGSKVFYEALKKTNSLTSKRKKEIKQLFDEIGNQSLKGYKETFEQKGIDYKLNPAMINILDYAKRVSNKDLKNLTKSIAYASKESYIKAVDTMYKEVVTGAYDYEKSIKKAVRNLTEEGITLKTKDGRNEQIDVAVKRNLYTSIHQTAESLALEVGKQINYNCVVIGHSSKCRPTHNVIDDVTMSKSEFQKYAYLTEEPNCNHIVNYDWQPEFEDKHAKAQYGDEHLTNAEVKRNYEKQQKSNYYARQVRNKKKQIASGDNSKEIKKQLRLAQTKLRLYNKANGIEQDYFNTWVAGYNK